MPVKKIVFYVMSALLAIMIVISGITIGKASALVQGILNPAPPASEPTASVTDTTEATDSTDSTKQTDATEPSGSVTPTDGPTETEHQHSYTVYESSPATCIEEGHTLYKCDCGDIETRDVVAALGHSYGAGQVVSSCTEESYTKYECSRCGHVDKRNITPASGHKFDLVEEFPATCTEDAYTVRKCSNPGCSESETEFLSGTSLGGHDYSVLKEEVKPTCTESGYTLYTCANPGCTAEPQKEEISPTGHTFGQWQNTANGKQNKCQNEGCNVTITTDQLQITKEYRSEDGSLYVIEVGTGINATDIRRLYTYDIEDNRSKAERDTNKLNYRFDSASGLVVEYKDGPGKLQTITLGFTNTSTTIETTSKPTESSTEPPTQAPTEAPTVSPTEAPTVSPTEALTEDATSPNSESGSSFYENETEEF